MIFQIPTWETEQFDAKAKSIFSNKRNELKQTRNYSTYERCRLNLYHTLDHLFQSDLRIEPSSKIPHSVNGCVTKVCPVLVQSAMVDVASGLMPVPLWYDRVGEYKSPLGFFAENLPNVFATSLLEGKIPTRLDANVSLALCLNTFRGSNFRICALLESNGKMKLIFPALISSFYFKFLSVIDIKWPVGC